MMPYKTISSIGPFHQESGLTWDPNAIANEAGHLRQHVIGVIWHAAGCMVEKAVKGIEVKYKVGVIFDQK